MQTKEEIATYKSTYARDENYSGHQRGEKSNLKNGRIWQKKISNFFRPTKNNDLDVL